MARKNTRYNLITDEMSKVLIINWDLKSLWGIYSIRYQISWMLRIVVVRIVGLDLDLLTFLLLLVTQYIII